jgi:hypothetical protein
MWVAHQSNNVAGLTALHTPTAGMRFRVWGIAFEIAAGMTAAGFAGCNIYDGAALLLTGPIYDATVTVNSSMVLDFTGVGGLLSSTDDNVLGFNVNAALNKQLQVIAWGNDE